MHIHKLASQKAWHSCLLLDILVFFLFSMDKICRYQGKDRKHYYSVYLLPNCSGSRKLCICTLLLARFFVASDENKSHCFVVKNLLSDSADTG